MEAFFRVIVNYNQTHCARLLPIVKFAYNKMKNANIEYIFFELNCRYHLQVSYKKGIDPCSRSKPANQLTKDLENLIAICKKNL